MHLNKSKMPREWPVPRKGTKYSVVPRQRNGIPLIIVLRDVLKIARTGKEAERILNGGNVSVNGKVRKDRRFSLIALDILAIKKLNKNYGVVIKKGKFRLEEIAEKDAVKRVCKVIGKKVLGKNKIQINLDNGNNMLCQEPPTTDGRHDNATRRVVLEHYQNSTSGILKFKDSIRTGDSVVIGLHDGKIIRIVPMQKNAKVLVTGGKHVGERGAAKEIKEKTAIIEIENKNVEIQKKNLMAVE
ncbi:hypothetical protein HYT92_03365 [Candidatus Pacearchaeota archaeon]|nr:hypothetical protein [Candidatus Pacearchaeota archaeon]